MIRVVLWVAGAIAWVTLLCLGSGCGDIPPAADAGAGADVAVWRGYPPPCEQPAGATLVFVPCDDGATAQCELRQTSGSTVPVCTIQGRRCAAACSAPDGGGQ